MPSEKDALAAIRPLRLIALGGLLCIFEYVPPELSGRFWRVDLLNDAVGMILIAMGAARLGRIPVHPPWNDHYGSAMKLVKLVAVLGVAVAAMDHFVFRRPPTLSVFLAIFRIVQMAAVVLLCMSMHWLSKEAGLARALRGWHAATWVFGVLLVLPLLAMSYSDFLTLVGGGTPHRELGMAEHILRGVLALPFVSLFLATSLMDREARRAGADAKPEGGGRC